VISGLFRRSGRRGATSGPEADDATEEVAGHPVIEREEEFAAYTEDCRIFGFIRHPAERLSDHLNDATTVHLENVLLVSLDDGRTAEAREMTVERDELLAVRAAGLRGNAARRSRTRPSPIILKTGPYIIHGYLHVRPGSDPIQHLRSRRAMVPLTGAWIEYQAVGEHHRARIGTIIVNRELIEWADRSRDEDVRVELPVETSIDPRAKDMTGHVLVGHAEPRERIDPD